MSDFELLGIIITLAIVAGLAATFYLARDTHVDRTHL
jgi:uncharacterized protein YneF (UPF0154 family)